MKKMEASFYATIDQHHGRAREKPYKGQSEQQIKRLCTRREEALERTQRTPDEKKSD